MSLTAIEEMLPFCSDLKSEALAIANPAIRELVVRYQKIFELIGSGSNLPSDRYRKIYENVALQDGYAHDTFLNTLKVSDNFLLDQVDRLNSSE